MGYFKELQHPDDSIPPIPETAGRIGYDPRLIDTLLRDHAELGRIYGRIGATVRSGNFNEVRLLLAIFKSRLEAHLLTENLRFYNYLGQLLADDPRNAHMVNEFRREMDCIAFEVVAFIKTYQSSEFTMQERRQFELDYAVIGKRLEHRLDCEEDSLYRLYRPG